MWIIVWLILVRISDIRSVDLICDGIWIAEMEIFPTISRQERILKPPVVWYLLTSSDLNCHIDDKNLFEILSVDYLMVTIIN